MEEAGVDACTKSFKLVDDVGSLTDVWLLAICEVLLGINVVLMG